MAKQNTHASLGTSPVSDGKLSYTSADILGEPYTRQQVLNLIRRDPDSYQIYLRFGKEHQEELLSILQGKRGLSITYDTFFKKVMDPDIHPKRLEAFLSAILGARVRIRMVLPHEGSKLTDAGSLVIMDILVELEDGTTINVEIQKIGYHFPGERCCCYISDMIMRQYNRVRAERGDRFTFRDMKPVILIVIMEESSIEFKKIPDKYIHRQQTNYDSGAAVTNLSKIIFLSLDTFRSIVHNISNPLEAWLTFLSSTEPEQITRLVESYPEFLSCYQDIIEFRRNPKELIYMYSEALTIMDRNTSQLMIEEMQDKLKEMQDKIIQWENISAQDKAVIAQKDASIAQKDASIAALTAKLEQLQGKK